MKLTVKLTDRMKKAAVVTLSVMVLCSGLLSASPAAYAAPVTTGGKALVTNTDGDNIRIRKGPGTDQAQISEAQEGQLVTVLEGPVKDSKGTVWYKVQAPRGTGWMMAEFLSGKDGPAAPQSKPAPAAPAAPPAAPAASAPKLQGFARVANTDGDRIRMRAEATTKGQVIAMLTEGTEVMLKGGPVTDSSGTIWYPVAAQGVSGWMMAQYLAQAEPKVEAEPAAAIIPPANPADVKDDAAAAAASNAAASQAAAPAAPVAPAAPAAPAAQPAVPAAQPAAAPVSSLGATIVSIAMRYNGYRYRFGGTSPAGFDCSGFIYYVMRQAGLSVGRTMPSQIRSGPRVSTKDLQPGDLLFWSNTYKPGLSHAGIYIGNGKFIHAENERTGVRISSMYTAYWASRFTAAVRPSR